MKISEPSRSALETPLNEIFSSEGNVRILRELSLAGSPLSKAEIARRSGISLAGVVKALPRLVDAGVVMPVGTGRRQVVGVREEHPLAGTLRLLFRTEALQKQQLMLDLTGVLASSQPPVRAAWLHDDAWASPRAPLGVSVLTRSGDVRAVQDALRPKLAALSAKFGISLELHVTTDADVAALPPGERDRLETASPLYGPDPLRPSPPAVSPGRARTHADRDAQSLRRAMWIAELLDRDPTLPQRARSWIVHRLHLSSVGDAAELQEWLHLLETAPIPTLQYLLVRVDERSDQLRQTNPFLMALSPEERRRMVKETAA